MSETATQRVGERRRRKLISALDAPAPRVVLTRRVGKDVHHVLDQVDDPDFAHAGSGVSAQLRAAVGLDRALGYLDHQQGIRRQRQAFRIPGVRSAQQHDVRLRFGVRPQFDRILHVHDGAAGKLARQQRVQRTHRECVRRTDRRHRDQHAVEQFDPLVGVEHAGFAHAVVLVEADAVHRYVERSFDRGSHITHRLCHLRVTASWRYGYPSLTGAGGGKSSSTAIASPGNASSAIDSPRPATRAWP